MFRFTFFVSIFFFLFSFSQNKYKNDQREGYWEGYYETGQLRYSGFFENGKEKGVFKYYYKSGNLEKELLYITPGIYAKAKMYYSNKLIKALGEYCLKQRCGTWEYFNDIGKIICKENYKNGVLDGDYIIYFDGILTDFHTYKNNKKNGISKSFFLSGNIKIISNYFNNKLNGEYVAFSEDGKMIQKGNYINGFREGEWYIYNEKKIINYKNGKIINTYSLYDKN